MAAIDPAARVAEGAIIEPNVSIGPFCAIGPDVVLREGVRLLAHVSITGHTTVGARTVAHPFVSLGSPPQSTKYRGGPTRLVIGADCDLREGVTMSIGTEDGGGLTEVGDRGFFMVGSHVGHDCRVGSDVVFANNAVLGGHVTVGDRAVFGGQAAITQYVRIGEGAMIAGVSGVRADVIPFGFALGQKADLVGLNVIGLRRRGVPRTDIHRLRQAYHLLFFGSGAFRDRLEQVAADYVEDALVCRIVEFIRAGGSRPLTMAISRHGAGGSSAPDEL